MTNETGFVYVLRNDSFPDLIKIGHTTRTVEERVRELNTTGVPTPFTILQSWIVPYSFGAEQVIHKMCGKYRNSSNREFFNIDCFALLLALMYDQKSVVEYKLTTAEKKLIADTVSAMNDEEPQLNQHTTGINNDYYIICTRALNYLNKIKPKVNSIEDYYDLHTYWEQRAESYSEVDQAYRSNLSELISNLCYEIYKLIDEIDQYTSIPDSDYDFDDHDKSHNTVTIQIFYHTDRYDGKTGEWGENNTHIKTYEYRIDGNTKNNEDTAFLILKTFIMMLQKDITSTIVKNAVDKTHRRISEDDIIQINGVPFQSIKTIPIGDANIPIWWNPIQKATLNPQATTHGGNPLKRRR